MSSTLLQRRSVRLGAVVLGLGVATTAALGLPWDLDMADSQAVEAFERPMAALPAGVVAQPSELAPRTQVPEVDRLSPDIGSVANPYADAELAVTDGERMYNTYCWPCHGVGADLGPVAQPGRFPGVLALTGPTGTLKNRPDGFVYGTMRHGGALMPTYGYAMSDYEMWSIVAYLRTLPGGAYTPPAPPAPEEGQP